MGFDGILFFLWVFVCWLDVVIVEALLLVATDLVVENFDLAAERVDLAIENVEKVVVRAFSFGFAVTLAAATATDDDADDANDANDAAADALAAPVVLDNCAARAAAAPSAPVSSNTFIESATLDVVLWCALNDPSSSSLSAAVFFRVINDVTNDFSVVFLRRPAPYVSSKAPSPSSARTIIEFDSEEEADDNDEDDDAVLVDADADEWVRRPFDLLKCKTSAVTLSSSPSTCFFG